MTAENIAAFNYTENKYLQTIAVEKLITWIKLKSQKTIKPNISNKTKNISGVDHVKQETLKYLCLTTL